MTSGFHTTTSWRTSDYALLVLSFVPAAILTWGVHEVAHWLTGVAIGYDMWITFNQAGPVQGSYDSSFHEILIAMAGPIVTWSQAVLAFAVVRRSRKLWTYSFLFLALWMRALAMCMSFISNPNDEARTSLIFGLPMWVIPGVSVILLLTLTFLGSRSLKVGWKGNVTSYVMASIVTTIVILSDQWLFTR
jgi:hypothetical protein